MRTIDVPLQVQGMIDGMKDMARAQAAAALETAGQLSAQLIDARMQISALAAERDGLREDLAKANEKIAALESDLSLARASEGSLGTAAS